MRSMLTCRRKSPSMAPVLPFTPKAKLADSRSCLGGSDQPMAMREERSVGVLEVVVPGERKSDALGATRFAAFTDELPAPNLLRVDLGHKVPDVPIHLSEQFAHGML